MQKEHKNHYIIPEDEDPVSYSGIEANTRELAGKILTIIDASISDERQNKSIKDLIKKEIRQYLFYFQDMCFKEDKGYSLVLPE